jgi:MerR family transcriptional regulator, thiopeptide resistance regulator
MDRAADTSVRQWRIGELAKRTGLSIRALRHYDEIGLLVPSERSFSGYRLYSDSDLQRLYRIVALRQLGMSLEEIARVLDGAESDLRETVRRQLEALERQRELQDRLRARLQSILEALDRAEEPSTNLFIEASEVTIMIEKYYTPQQLEQLAQRERELGPEAVEQAQREWGELITSVERERAQGTDFASPRMQDLARRWQELIGRFTGGDAGIRDSLRDMYDREGAERASRGAVDHELMEYVGEAIRALEVAE